LPAGPKKALSSDQILAAPHHFGPDLIILAFKPNPTIAAVAFPGGPFDQFYGDTFLSYSFFFFPIKK
jgi:hypothetical protein